MEKGDCSPYTPTSPNDFCRIEILRQFLREISVREAEDGVKVKDVVKATDRERTVKLYISLDDVTC